MSFQLKQQATGSGDNSAALWDAATGRLLFELEGHTAGVAGVAFSPDGDRVLTGSKDNLAKLWDARKGKELLTLKGHTEEITGVAFSRQGNLALTASRDGTTLVWPAEDWKIAPATESLAPDATTSDNRGR